MIERYDILFKLGAVVWVSSMDQSPDKNLFLEETKTFAHFIKMTIVPFSIFPEKRHRQ